MAAPAPSHEAARVAARAARESYGRLVALLAYRWRDLAAAEDALGDAFAQALQHWPASGVPSNPDAWLMKAAQRMLLMGARHARVAHDPLVSALFDAEPTNPEPPVVPDERLKLMFVCAHPALSARMHAPLMLQTVLGLEAQAIAQAFLVSPAAMAQRLVRAKGRIRDVGLRFEVPEASELPARLGGVLDAIYGAYTIGKRGLVAASDANPAGLTEEALYLGGLLAALMPGQPEALGLLALMLFCEARRPAQFDADGRFVPLGQQDVALWRRDVLSQAEQQLWQASRLRQPGPFQIEAAIQSAHCQRAFTGQTPWAAIAQLYGALVQHHPSAGARVGQAVAVAESGAITEGLALLDRLPATDVEAYQAFWAARAHLLRLAGRDEAARQAGERAVGLTEDARVRAYLVSTYMPKRSA